MNIQKILIPVMILFSGFGFSQNQNKGAAQNGKYLYFDASQSFQGNELIDHLSFLIDKSRDVELPKKVVKMLDEVQDDPQLHSKLTYMRASVLKVMYNDKVSPDDKKFISNHYLNNPNNQKYEPILPILQKYLSKGTL